jgi:hypothetical protein
MLPEEQLPALHGWPKVGYRPWNDPLRLVHANAGDSDSARATPQAEVFGGHQSPHPAAAGFFHSLLTSTIV